MRLPRVAAVAAVAVAVSLLPAQAASAEPGAAVRSGAVAEIRQDGAIRRDSDFDVWASAGRLSVVSNVAVAYARCTGCRALAVSFQVVLVRRAEADLAVTNRAVAVTDHCRRCEALAFAYQWVVVTGSDRSLSRSGRWQLRLLGRRLRWLVRSAPPGPVLAGEVESLARQVQRVLATEVRTGVPPAPRVRWSSERR